MASGNTLCVFFPMDNEPPSSNYAVFSTENGHPILGFDDTTSWTAIFTGILPRQYAGGGITVYLHWTAIATSGTGGWTVSFERMSDNSTDLDSDSFASGQTVTAVTVPGTSGIIKVSSVAVTDGANIDGLTVGDSFRLKISRDVTNDNAVGNLQLMAVELKET
jgi:hypothetical protein